MRTTWLTKAAASSLRIGGQVCGLALVLAACSGVVWAGGPGGPGPGAGDAPEIDPGSVKAAVMLLGGGVMLVADRFRRRSG